MRVALLVFGILSCVSALAEVKYDAKCVVMAYNTDGTKVKQLFVGQVMLEDGKSLGLWNDGTYQYSVGLQGNTYKNKTTGSLLLSVKENSSSKILGSTSVQWFTNETPPLLVSTSIEVSDDLEIRNIQCMR